MSDYSVKPLPSRSGIWHKVVANSPEEAVQQFVDKEPWTPFIAYMQKEPDFQEVRFYRVEVENFGEFLVRVYHKGLFRRGGVAAKEQTLEDLAGRLGWKGDPKELLQEGWDLEEEEWK